MNPGEETAGSGKGRLWVRRAAWLLGGAVCLALALFMLYARFCAFTNFKDGTSGDYARYTNMLWNTLHGRPFQCFMDASYLATHLSFSLVLLSPCFLAFDHPFLLAFLQWALMVAGAWMVWRLSMRLQAPGHLVFALLFFWLTHPFVQSVVLCEFHGVSTYFVTVPLLYYCLLFRRQWVWAPLVVILGLREDAGLVVVPLLLYFAVRERWRAGYVYAAVALAYVLLACLVLYPAVNGVSLLARRVAEIPMAGEDDLPDAEPLWLKRGISLLTIVMVVLPFLRYGWKPLLILPSVAILVTLGSRYHSQVVLRIHYPAILVSLLMVALLQSWRTSRAAGRRRWWALCSVYLVLWTSWSYYADGMTWGSRKAAESARFRVYQRISPKGLHALRVARNHVPRTGVLYTERRLAGFVANRKWISVKRNILDDPTHKDLWAFCSRAKIPESCRQGLVSNMWGVVYLDEAYAVLGRGADPAGNAEALARLHSGRR